MITFLFPQGARVDWLVAETSRRQKDFAQILQLVMWICTILFAVGVLRHTSPYTHAISRMDTFKDKGSIESCCILASRVPVYGTKDAGRGLWLRLKNTCKLFKFP